VRHGDQADSYVPTGVIEDAKYKRRDALEDLAAAAVKMAKK
jgi:hypothetical protein